VGLLRLSINRCKSMTCGDSVFVAHAIKQKMDVQYQFFPVSKRLLHSFHEAFHVSMETINDNIVKKRVH